MNSIKWLDDNRIQITPPKKTKKITGTRFATILGLNPWSTDFEMWCAITKTYEVPFEDTVYTIAGKTIEPKQAEYMKRSYGMDLISPTDKYGADYFNKTYGDFFPENKKLGGMWDYLATDEEGKVDTVLEMKTTKRAEDWEDDIPEYYALQAALYAYLLGIDNVVMVASFLDEKDYDKPENYKPSIKNTITVEFKVSERYPDFADKVAQVEKWWNEHVKTGISPVFDEKRDEVILKALRTNSVDTTSEDIQSMIAETEKLKVEVDKAEKAIKEKADRLDVLNKAIKTEAVNRFRDGDKKVEIKGISYIFSVSKTEPKEKPVYDDEAMKIDGVYEKYVTMQVGEPTYRLTITNNKEDK